MLDDVKTAAAECRRVQRGGRILVFGGSGYTGRAAITALVRHGYQVTAAFRHAAGPVAQLQGLPEVQYGSMVPMHVNAVRCDATKIEQVRRAATGASVLVNAILGSGPAMLAATRAIAEVARETGCRILHVSSIAVYGDVNGGVVEDAKLLGKTRYAQAKIACEMALAGSNAVILRPGLIYGPGDERWTGRLFRLLRRRRLGDLGEAGDGRCNLVHALDFGETIVAAVENAETQGYAINVAAPRPLRWNSVLITAACALGVTPVRRLSAWRLQLESEVLAPPLLAASRAIALLRLPRNPRLLPEAITPTLRRLFVQDFWLDQTLAERFLPVQHQIPALALHECASWFRDTYRS